jgi:hypothetical protein
MSDAELKALLAEVARQQSELARQQSERAKEHDELAKRQAQDHAKTEAAQRRTEETLRRVTKQLGGLGNKFGSYTEGLAFESVERILRAKFQADTLARRVKSVRGGFGQEYDLIGVRNGVQGEVYCAEIKSELNAEELAKSLKKFGEFSALLPQYRGMKLYGIICAVDVRGALAQRVMHEGLYLATAGDENFKLVKPPPDFKPRVFTAD